MEPDDPGKPEALTDLTRPSARYVLGKTAREFTADQCTDLAAVADVVGFLLWLWVTNLALLFGAELDASWSVVGNCGLAWTPRSNRNSRRATPG